MMYNAACIYSQLGNSDRAVETLRNAIDAGFKFIQWMRSDPDLQPLRERDDFRELLARFE
jgi:hypothetical protein